jgi:hypothetical protein
MSDRIEKSIDATVLQQAGGFGGLDAFRRYIGFIIDARGGQGVNRMSIEFWR